MSKLTLLTDWIRLKHEGQLIRQTDQPYFDHLVAVADMSAPLIEMGFEIGLCHDLLEKTATKADEFKVVLINFGYRGVESAFIVACVVELTDVFTKAAYPHLPKIVRKEKEAWRLIGISAEAQTVKYADLIYNMRWVYEHDRINAETYLRKKRLLIDKMSLGNNQLREQALVIIDHLLTSLP